MDEVYDTIQHVDQSNIAQDIQLPMLSPQLTLACLLAFGASLMIPASPVFTMLSLYSIGIIIIAVVWWRPEYISRTGTTGIF
eukprot:9469399-Pyramimonas_sp.AAC.1